MLPDLDFQEKPTNAFEDSTLFPVPGDDESDCPGLVSICIPGKRGSSKVGIDGVMDSANG